MAPQDERLRGLVEPVELRGADAVGADERAVLGLRDGVLHEARLVEELQAEFVRHHRVDVGLAGAAAAAVQQPRPGEARRRGDLPVADQPQAVHRDPLAALLFHDLERREVVLRGVDQVAPRRLDDLLGGLGVLLGHGDHFGRLLDRLERVGEPPPREEADRQPERLHPLLRRLAAAEHRDLRAPETIVRLDHLHPEPDRPEFVIARRGEVNALAPRRGHDEPGKPRVPHAQPGEDDRRDAALGDLVRSRPR